MTQIVYPMPFDIDCRKRDNTDNDAVTASIFRVSASDAQHPLATFHRILRLTPSSPARVMSAISRYFTRDFLSTLAVDTVVDIALLLRFSVVILSMTDRHRSDLWPLSLR
jgi:hypothetical protein